jgi:rsbT co-antagonist protein RsbR
VLRAIRANPAKVVVIDITGVAPWTPTWRITWSRRSSFAPLGATVIVTGLSPEIAQTLVNIGAELSKMSTVGDL